ncbi:hypothetical protein CF168_16155 [Shewanella bicestrii]|uniref:DUF2339 domain-containing protein n=1 Tax=Shewanella bicestrii TaxID=2018305 RepID=A0A220UQS8_9GAMM|nr:DUF2339 domain-containing protein [Shewanella bicestrii]ASK70256.1 hypothetical protein CF168_16155 [Shewanella bicestrii]
MPLKDDVDQLKAELAQLKLQHLSQQSSLSRQLAEFSAKLDSISLQLEQQGNGPLTTASTSTNDIIAPYGTTIDPRDEIAPLQSEEMAPHIQPQAPEANPWQDDPWQRHAKSPSTAVDSPVYSQQDDLQQDKAFSQQAGLEVGVQAASQLETLLSQGLAAIMAPFAAITEQVKGFYQHYQAKGLGPVFLMTVAGIITLTLGFGYLLQYSINHWFSELGKALLGFGCANAIIAGGIFIRQKRAGMADFGSGIVGLGLILNYLCAYFIGPYFEIIPNSASFILLLLITLSGYGLSMRLDAKVIAVIALVGGSMAPMMLLSQSYAPLLYIPYLLLIGAGALAQSRKLHWPLLLEITAFLHIACIEAFSYFVDLPLTQWGGAAVLALVSINALFYLYGLFGFIVNSSTNTLSHRALILPIALLAFALFEITQFTPFAGEIFIANALICAGLYVKLKSRLKPSQSSLLLVFGGSFAAFAALYLLSHDFLGLVLILEALLLLWIGLKEKLISVRAEAYVLLLTGLALNLYAVLTGFSLLGLGEQTPVAALGFPLLALALSAAALLFVIRQIHSDELPLSRLERQLSYLFKELLSGFYAATLLLAAYLVSSDYYLAIIPLVSLLLLHLSAKDKLMVSEFAAWLLLLPLLFTVVEGVTLTDSLSFSAQPLIAKLARIELFAALLLAHYWYRKHYPSSLFAQAAKQIQLGCYLLLPLMLLPKVMRSYWEFTAVALWLSSLFSLGLAYVIKHKALEIETKILTWLAILTTASLCLFEVWQGLIALLIGALVMGFVLLRYRKLAKPWASLLTLQWQLSPYYFALVLAVLVYGFNRVDVVAWSMTALALSGYFALLIQRRTKHGSVQTGLIAHIAIETQAAVRSSYSMAYGLCLGLALLPIMLHFELSLRLDLNNVLLILCELMALALLALLILRRGVAIRLHQRFLPLQWLKWGWHGLLALSYLTWSYTFDNIIAAPLSAILLVVHGSVLMFISLKPQHADMIRLAAGLFTLATLKVLLLDMASFELVQKVIAFMVIGVILLTVSYFYQKARNRLQEANQ